VKRRALYFTGYQQVEVWEEPLAAPAPGQVQVQTLVSAISPGTEGLIYNNLFPEELALDESIVSLAGPFGYPLKYGYCLVGRVSTLGEGVSPEWQGQQVFAFHPHESAFNASPDELMLIPSGIEAGEAVFLPNMETAVNLVMDGAPLLGERVVVFGQGIIGLLTTALLGQFPLERLLTVDRYKLRRETSITLGAHDSLDPAAAELVAELRLRLAGGADLTFELSGAPQTLDQAIAVTGFAGRVMVGSWYGKKRTPLDLGGYFHRSRIRLVSSQVSTLAPELAGRWTKERRFTLAWEMIRKLKLAKFITHQYSIAEASQAYRLLQEQPETALQVVFQY
jgi:2-desacetyl-2-hydroxyethyl bacteriochlorophyllide A dehydrogenase